MINKKLFVISLVIVGLLAIGVAGINTNMKQYNRNNYQITTLYEGWNMMGYPSQGKLSKQDVTVIYNNTEYIWEDAVNQQIILNFIYSWNADVGIYEFTDEFEGGKGYWVYSYFDCNLWYIE